MAICTCGTSVWPTTSTSLIALNLITIQIMVMWPRISIFWPWTWTSTVFATWRDIFVARFAEAPGTRNCSRCWIFTSVTGLCAGQD